MNDSLLSLRDLTADFRLPGGMMRAVDRVSLDVAPGVDSWHRGRKWIGQVGINDYNLYRWRGQYSHQEMAKARGSNGNMGEMEAELKRLRREVEVLRQERDVLKKAMHIISRSQT